MKLSYFIYGKHAVLAALNNPKREVVRVLASRNAVRDMPELSGEVEEVDQREIEKLLQRDAVHQGVMAEVFPLDDVSLEELEFGKKSTVVIADQVSDPHNIGAIARSCAAFGAAALILPRNHSPQESGVMAKSASGALEVVPLVRVTNLVAAMEHLKEQHFWCLGLDGSANLLLEEAPSYDRTALVLGAEGKGMRRLTEEHCDLLVKLPISDKVESLNVSNAAAVALYALRFC